MGLLKLRAALSIMALLSVVSIAVIVVFWGAGLNPLQAGVLGTIIAALIKDNSSSFGFIFDGVPTDDSVPHVSPVQPSSKETT